VAGAAEADLTAVAVDVTIAIHDLRQVPEHWATVVDRIWQAWWRPYGAPLADVEAALAEVAAAADFPSFTLVAVDAGRFAGTVTVIKEDIDARPQLRPCIAALWVDPSSRGQGVAQRLLNTACARLARAGCSRVYLGARPPLRRYYSGHGWTLHESGVGSDRLDVFVRALP
jgi:predicted N-acetyltransferase YhbS